MAAEVKIAFPQTRVVLIHSRQSLLSSEPLLEAFKDKAMQLSRDLGVELKLSCRVLETHKSISTDGKALIGLKLSDGETTTVDEVINTITRRQTTSHDVRCSFFAGTGDVQVLPRYVCTTST
jgi:hypothetical protein